MDAFAISSPSAIRRRTEDFASPKPRDEGYAHCKRQAQRRAEDRVQPREPGSAYSLEEPHVPELADGPCRQTERQDALALPGRS